MLHIIFMYRDEYTHGEWQEQECVVSSIDECIKLYGLNECEYKIVRTEII